MTSASAPRIRLPAGLSLVQVVDASRYGALAFLNGVLAEWGKKELGAWLVGSYDRITRVGGHEAPTAASPRVPRISLAPYAVTRVMREAHDEVIETLRTLRNPDGAAGFVFDALGSLVGRCEDESGEAGWIPVARPRMRLADRVLSLIAADYLARPEDFEQSLAVCGQCTLVAFDAAARSRGLCRVHSVSGIRFKSSEALAAATNAEPEASASPGRRNA